jgi:dipeptidyl aminopeptidase/acylaminoacyl peptidase
MKKIEIDDLYRFYSLGDISWSPDGELGVFLKWRIDRESNGYLAGLYLISDGNVTELKGEAGCCTGPVCWIEGHKLLFGVASDLESSEGITFRLLDVDTEQVTEGFGLPQKSEKIRAAAEHGFVVQIICENQTKDEECYVIDEIPYKSNGMGYRNKVRRRLSLYDPEKKKFFPVTDSFFESKLWEVSEDGTKLLFTGMTPEGVGHQYDGLYLYDIDTGTTSRLIKEGIYRIDGIAFANDHIIMAASDQKRYGMDQNPVIYTVDYQGNVKEKAFWDGSVSGSSVNSDTRYGTGTTFLTDGDTVYFVTTYWERSLLCSVRGGEIRAYEELKINPEFIAVHYGQCLIIGTEEQKLQEIYLADLTGDSETAVIAVKRITDFSDEVLADFFVSEPQPLNFTDAGGNEIQGWVLLPENYKPNGKYPAVLEIHGGPKTVYGTGFHHEMQMFASAGYLVFFCNPPGSDGRGDEFADIRGCYGQQDYDAVMKFTDLVLKNYPAIDRHRMGVAGGSYGGFMTNWIIGHTDRFAAAVSQRSMANLVTIKTTTDIGHYSVHDHHRADISRNVEELWRQSPIRYAFRAVTPTLFLHSDEDHRCWQVEAMQMFSELKLQGVSTRLCIFKKENHELSRKGRPKGRIRRLKEMLQWLDGYLK